MSSSKRTGIVHFGLCERCRGTIFPKYRPRASDLTMGACGFGDQIKGLFPSAETRTRAWDGLTWHVSPSPSPTLLLIKREAACSAATRARVWGGRVANSAGSTVK